MNHKVGVLKRPINLTNSSKTNKKRRRIINTKNEVGNITTDIKRIREYYEQSYTQIGQLGWNAPISWIKSIKITTIHPSWKM